MLITKYELTDRANAALSKIDEARELLESHLDQPEEWHGVIRRQVMAAAIHYSTAIEGNVLTRDQVESIIAGEAIEAPEKDRVEALNYYRASRWCATRANDAQWRLTHETVLTLHFMVGTELGPAYEPLGQYRHGQNNVQDRRSGEVIFWPPRPAEVPGLMDELIDWARVRTSGDLNPYVLNALVHLNFVAVHPFSDGNGRVARLLCSLMMMREGYKAQAFWSLEQYLGEHSVDYGKAISKAVGPRWHPERAIATTWIEWYLEAVAAQVQDAAESLRRSVAEFTAIVAGLSASEVLPNDASQLARRAIPLWLAVTKGSVTRRQLARHSDVSAETLSRDLRKLADLRVLKRVGKGRGAHYLPGSVMDGWGDFNDLVNAALDQGLQGALAHLADKPPTLFD